MKKYISEKGTIFFGIGLLGLLISVIYCMITDDRLGALYIGLGIIPISIFILLDRFFVWKYGQQQVNRVQLYIIGILFIINFIRFLISLFIEIIE